MRYVALLRGIMPTNPNMRGEKLRQVFEELGFTNVGTVIASGNVVFDSGSKSVSALEKRIEAALPEKLGFRSTAIVRSQEELEALVRKDPFKGIPDRKPNYLLVTFFKDRREEISTTLDLRAVTGTQFMSRIEKKHGKEITTRTWKTVGRILKKMHD